MIRRKLVPLFCLWTAVALAAGPTARELVKSAQAKAASEDKVVLLNFGASWCPYCQRLDAWLERPEIKRVFIRYFVPVQLSVRETEHKATSKRPDTRGADSLFDRYGGPASIPLLVFLDKQGKVIVNSIRTDKTNIASPGRPEEASFFVQMLKKAAPRISDEDLKVVETSLKAIDKPLLD